MKQEIAFGILKTGRNVFLTGSAGTGKTYLLNNYINYLKERGIKPAIVAPTGIAASHIGGMTIHSFFGIGIEEYHSDYMIDILLQKEFLYKRLSKVKVLIVDEISMVSPELFTTMDKVLQVFKSCNKPFGGVQLILSGDFFQLPPVNKKNKEIKFAWQTASWKNADLRNCYLQEKFRYHDGVLVNILDEIRSGAVSAKTLEVFHNCRNKELSGDIKITRLYTHNEDVDRINAEELKKLPEVVRIFVSQNRGAKKNVEKIFKSSLVVEELKLKKGAVVIFIKNNYEKGYVNGTLGQIVDFYKGTGAPIVKIFSGAKIVAEAENWEMENAQGEVKAVIKQIPLRLAWALTVHKSQGMTLDAAEIDLSKTFETGQGYVALSRIKSIDGLKLMGFNDIALQVDQKVMSIDKEIKRLSDLNVRKFASFSQEMIEKMNKEFIIKNEGILGIDEIKNNQRKLKRDKKKNKLLSSAKSKGLGGQKNTLEETKELLLKKKMINEIAKERIISPRTVLSHIEKISKIYPDFDISYLKPEKEIVKKVKKAIKEIEIKKYSDDFLENGNIKLRAIFKFLKEKVSYNDIKLAIIFGDRE